MYSIWYIDNALFPIITVVFLFVCLFSLQRREGNWSEEKALLHHDSGGYLDIYICQNLLYRIIKIGVFFKLGVFIVCTLYLMKLIEKKVTNSFGEEGVRTKVHTVGPTRRLL